MQKVLNVVLIISLLANITLGFIVFTNSNKNSEVNSIEYLNKIDSLELVISDLNLKRDSINSEIDTVNIIINKVVETYEKDYDIIIGNTTSDDYFFFTGYLERNRERLFSGNNSTTTKRN